MVEREKMRLLWVDDDGLERFVYEVHILEEEGWEVLWASNVDEAAALLCHERVDAMLLDQMLPFSRRSQIGDAPDHAGDSQDNNGDVWGGCRLLRWLRGAEPPRQAPPLKIYTKLRDLLPLAGNQTIPVYVVSGFYDEVVERSTKEASELDRDTYIAPKPVDIEALLTFLQSLSEERHLL